MEEIKDGDRITVEAIPGEHAARVHVGKRKRGGRKPGSKNKPKPSPSTGLLNQVAQLSEEITRLRAAVAECVTLLQHASSIRIGAMDSESRVADLAKQQQQYTGEAYQRLRSMLPG